jgi:deoxyribonuclease IV
MLLGAHVSIAGGVSNAPGNGLDIGAETIQIFSKNQRQWQAKPYAREEVDGFRQAAQAAGFHKTVVHGSYLINLGATKSDVHKRSVSTFRDEVRRCHALGIPYFVFHPGAHTGAGESAGIKQIVATLKGILEKEGNNPTMLLVENTAGQGTVVGHTLEQIAQIVHGVGDPRMGVCLDTAHCIAAGFDVRTPAGFDGLLDRFHDTVGLQYLRAMHLNDAVNPLGSRVDRHANLGEGQIGWPLFEHLVNHPRLAGIPGNLETPGGPDEWRREIERLKAARRENAPDRSPGDLAVETGGAKF